MREIAVFGLGKFGKSVAEAFSKEGGSVLAIDKSQERIQEISDVVTYAVRADIADIDVMRQLGLGNVDASVVAVADNLEAAIMATILSKEAGVPYIIAKAQNEVHATVLKKVGADKIIFPEKEMGIRIARNLTSNNFMDIIDLSDDFSIVEVPIRQEWVGKTLKELEIRKKYGFNIVAERINDDVNVSINPDEPLKEESMLVIIGDNKEIAKVFS